MKIDLRKCKKGDILISQHGLRLKYLEFNSVDNDDYPHLIEYPDNSCGTRTHNGNVYLKNHKPTDHNIVKIIPIRKLKLLKLLENEKRNKSKY